MAKLKCSDCGLQMTVSSSSKAHLIEIRCRCGGTYQPFKAQPRPAPIDKTVRPWAGEKGKGDEPVTDS